MIELLDTPSEFENLVKERLREETITLIEKEKTSGRDLKIIDGKKKMVKNTTKSQKKATRSKKAGGGKWSPAQLAKRGKVAGKKIKKNFKRNKSKILKKKKRSENKRGNR